MRNEHRSEARPSSQRGAPLWRLNATSLPEYFQAAVCIRQHSAVLVRRLRFTHPYGQQLTCFHHLFQE